MTIKREFLKQLLLFFPAVCQLLIFFVGRDFYPFSNNEMYAGHPSPQNFQVIYLIGVRGEKELLSVSEFQQEILSTLIEQELAKDTPDFNAVCAILEKDMHKKNPVDVIRIEQRSWDHLTKNNVTRPDHIKVLHECKYR